MTHRSLPEIFGAPITKVPATDETLSVLKYGCTLVLPLRRYTIIALVALCAAGTFSDLPAFAQQPAAQRKVLSKVIPVYPDLARHMGLGGAVRLEVVVAPDGTVKSLRAVGGSPLLLKAAQDVIPKWKWAPAAQESKELVELTFHPN
jgi:TonB family protein